MRILTKGQQIIVAFNLPLTRFSERTSNIRSLSSRLERVQIANKRADTRDYRVMKQLVSENSLIYSK